MATPSNFQQPPLGKSVVASFPTPSQNDAIIVFNKNVCATGYRVVDYGTPHEQADKYPDYKLSLIKPSADGQTAMWFYVTDRANDDAWNFTLKYSHESRSNQIVVRTYTLPREKYAPAENGADDPVFEGLTLTHEEEVALSEQPEMASLYIKVVRVYENLTGPVLTTLVDTQAGYYQTPEVFRQNDEINETIQDVATGSDPTAATGTVLESVVKPTDIIKAVRTNKILTAGTAPTLTSKITNRVKQLATQVKRLITTGSSSAAPSATVSVEVEDLGNGKSVETVTTDPSLFGANKFSKQIDDPVPLKFRAAIPTVTSSGRSAGTAAAPSLSTGDLAKSEEQLDAFVKETSATTRAGVSLPVVLNGQQYNERFNLIIPYTEKLVAAGSLLGTAATEIEPLGGGYDLARTFDLSAIASVLNAYSLVYPGTSSLEFPDVMTGWTLNYETHTGVSDGAVTGSGSWSGQGSYSVPASQTVQTSQSVMPEFVEEISQTWARNVPTMRAIFFLPAPVTSSAVLGKVSSILGATTAWPKFHPQAVTAVLIGRQASMKVEANYHIQDGGSGSGSEHSESGGTTYTSEVGLTIKTTRVPPTIHPSLTGGGPATSFSPAAVSLTATAWTQTLTKTFPAVVANFAITGLGATAGDTTIPVSGQRLLHSDAEPFMYGYVMIHAEVVDFADI